MGASYYDTLMQGLGDRPWLHAMQNIDAARTRSVEEVRKDLGSTIRRSVAIDLTLGDKMASPSSASRQIDSKAGEAQQTEPKSTSSLPKTFEEILRGIERVPTALKK
jgi:hypothetical protein